LIGHGNDNGRHGGIKCQNPRRAKKFAPFNYWIFDLRWAIVLYMKFILSTHNVTLTKSIEDHILSRIEKLEHMDAL